MQEPFPRKAHDAQEMPSSREPGALNGAPSAFTLASRNRRIAWFFGVFSILGIVLLSFFLSPWWRSPGIIDQKLKDNTSVTKIKPKDREADFRQILVENPRNSDALHELGTLELSRGKLEEALTLAARLQEAPDGELRGEVLLARVHHAAGRRAEAIHHFHRVLELDPGLSKLVEARKYLWREFGDDLLREGRAAEAREILILGYRQDGSAQGLDLLGQACLDLGDDEAADHWWRLSTEANAGRIEPWILRGRLALKNHQLEDALDSFTRAEAFDPRRYEVLFSIGRVHQLRGDEVQASRYLEKAAEAQRALPPPTGGMGALPVPANRPRPTNRPQ